MIFGLTDNNDKVVANKKIKAFCPFCKKSLIAKCGRILTHHWAHKEADVCPYATGMTEWHYQWLMNFNSRFGEGWEIEYFFDSIRFDAYNPIKKQAIEFQRIIDLDYIGYKIEICKKAGIKLFWLINPQTFYNFIYSSNFKDQNFHILFPYRRSKRKIFLILENYVNENAVSFLIDFNEKEYLPKYSSDKFGDRVICGHNIQSDRFKHPMLPGIYIIDNFEVVKSPYFAKEYVIFLKYREKKCWRDDL